MLLKLRQNLVESCISEEFLHTSFKYLIEVIKNLKAFGIPDTDTLLDDITLILYKLKMTDDLNQCKLFYIEIADLVIDFVNKKRFCIDPKHKYLIEYTNYINFLIK